MRSFILGAAFILLSCSSGMCAADEILVTGTRLNDPSGTPHVALPRRADFVLHDLRIDCDTRERAQRVNEIKTTLRSMLAAAGAGSSISLGIRAESGNDEFVLPLTEDRFDPSILPDAKRPDASFMNLLVKSPVLAGETSERPADARIEAFVKKVKGAGRSTLTLEKEFELSVVDPDQYRLQILKLIAADAKAVAAILDGGYGAELRSIQRRVEWVRTGPVDLALFLPYELHVVPSK